MTRQAKLADGTLLEFPDETPDHVIDMAVKRHVAPTEGDRIMEQEARKAAPPRQSLRAVAERGAVTRPAPLVRQPLARTTPPAPRASAAVYDRNGIPQGSTERELGLTAEQSRRVRAQVAKALPEDVIAADGYGNVGTRVMQSGKLIGAGLLRAAAPIVPGNYPRDRAEAMERYGQAKIEGDVTLDDIGREGVGMSGAAGLGQFIAQMVPSTAVSMAGLANPLTWTTLGTSMVGNMGQARAEADGRDAAGIGDLAASMPFVGASLALDKFGLDRVLAPLGRTAGMRIGSATAGEGLTEAAQSGIEYAGGSLGTRDGFDPAQAGQQAIAGALGGVALGGGISSIREGAGAITSGIQQRADEAAANQAFATMAATSAFDPRNGVPMNAPPPEIAAPEPQPAAPAPAPEVKMTPVEGDPFQTAPAKAIAPAPPVAAPQPVAPVTPAAAGGDGLGTAVKPDEPQPAPAAPVATPEPAANPDEPKRFTAAIAAGLMAKQDKPEAAEPAPLRPEPGDLAEGERMVRTPAGGAIRTRFEVVDASSLKQAEGANQNRDRSRETTDLQVQDIIAKFDPELLHEDPSSDRGAPIVGEDGAIDSGNGRMLTLNRIYEQYPEQAARYRAMIEGRGFSTQGMERPVLVQRRMTQFTPEQRRQFVIDSNKDTKLELSPTERARSDADSITPTMLATYAGGDLNSTVNAGFVQAFNARLTAAEMGNMIGSDRRLTTAGAQRIENAVVAAAYGKPKLLERMMESSHDDIRSITGSLADVAGPWARMRAAAKAGDIDTSYDITDQLAAAAARVSDARKSGTKPADILAQSDAFDPIDPMEAELIRAFHNSAMSRAASRKAVSTFLQDYLEAAQSQKAAVGLFGEEPLRSPISIAKELLEARDNPNGAGLALEPKDNANVDAAKRPSTEDAGSGGGRARKVAPRQDEGRPATDGAGRSSSLGQDADGILDEALDYVTEDASPEDPYAPDFMTASFTSRTSIFNAAAEALGMDPDAFTLLPAPRQVALLQRAIRERFGVEVTVDHGMQERFAIDQMLDAYQTVQGMAHVLDLPSQAISLTGKLKLKLQKSGKFLGAFAPSENLIMLPQRSNSFAHEWAHALDWHLLAMTAGHPGRGLSGAIRQRGDNVKLAAPVDVREAFVDLLNAMFFDKAGAAAKIMELEAKVAQTKSTKVKAESQAQIDRLRDGSSQARNIRSAFYKGAQVFDGPSGEYWTSPTEMFARAFEAYVSYKTEAAGLTTEFIGKGDANYLSNAEARFAKTFPKGEERAHIFAAFEQVFARIADAEMLGQGPGAARPTSTTRRISDYSKEPDVPKQGIWAREKAELRRARLQREKDTADRADGTKGWREKTADVNGSVTMSMTGQLRMIQKRTGSRSLQRLIDLLTKQDGKGDRTVTRTFSEDVHLQSRAGINRIDNILRANGLDVRSAGQDVMLRDLLIGAINPDGSLGPHAPEGETAYPRALPANYVKAAAAIRHVLDNEFYVNQKAGIDLGYTRSGYLARILDMPKVYFAPAKFVSQAAKVYEIVFDKEYGKDPDDVLNDEEKLPVFMRLARFLQKKGHDIPSLDEVRALLKKIKQLAARAAKAEDPDVLNGQVAKLSEELGDLFGQLYDEVRPAFGRERAEAWMAKINLHAGEEHNAASPDSKYTKKRDLPPEADKLMEQFYLRDPIESVVNYLNVSARRTAYARRFGTDGKKRLALFEGMASEGVSPEDQQTVEMILDTATGRVRSTLPTAVQGFFSFVQALTSFALLPRATLSSLGEPFTSGIITGDALSGFKMVAKQVQQGLGAPSGKRRAELARAMGIISSLGADGIMEARYGQTFADETRWDKIASQMFRNSGLTGLTRSQKIAGVGMGHAFLDNLAGAVDRGKGAEAANAVALMRELGIRHPEAFAKQLLAIGRLPSVEDLETDFGHDYATAQHRYSRMIVQEPDAMDRPLMSQNPIGRVIYGITGFSYGYWRNVIKRSGILLNEMRKRSGPLAAMRFGQLLAAAATAYLLNTTISTVREFYLNPQRWSDLERKGELHTQMAQLGFTRTFAFGAADPVIQTYSGLKYQRDAANLFVGAGPGFLLQNMQRIATLGIANSRKTNTAEHNALRATYSLTSPFIAMGLTRLPGGPVINTAKGVATAVLTAPVAGTAVASAVVGPKDTPKTRTPTVLDQMLDRQLGPVKRKPREE